MNYNFCNFTIFIFFFYLISTGCSSNKIINSNSLIEPPSFLELEIIENKVLKGLDIENELKGKSRQVSFASKYLVAKKFQQSSNYQNACNLYKDLSVQDDFPLRNIALVRSIEVCDYKGQDLHNIWDNTKVKPWEDKVYSRISLQKAIIRKDKKYIVKFAMNLSKLVSLKSEKINLIKLALTNSEQENQEKLNKELYIIAPRYNLKIDTDNILIVSKDFAENRNFEKAKKLYLQIINNNYSFTLKRKAYNQLRLLYKANQEIVKYINTTKDLVELVQDELRNNSSDELINILIDSQVTLARALWTIEKPKEALLILNGLTSQNLSYSKNAEIRLIISLIFTESKKYSDAVQMLTGINFDKVSDLRLLKKIYWNLSWNFILDKKYSFAINTLKSLRGISKLGDGITPKTMYWEGFCYRELDSKEDSKKSFTELAKRYPFNFYGIMAHREVKIKFTPLKFDIHNVKDGLYGIPILNWSIAMSEYEFAGDYLASYVKKTLSRHNTVRLFPSLHTMGLFPELLRNSSLRVNSGTDIVAMSTYARYLFPKAYENEVSESSRALNVSKALIWAVMRQESGFRARVKSGADAYGLMQLIFPTAKQVSKIEGIKIDGHEQLYHPQTNIRLGTSYLKHLRKKFNNRFISYVSSYNTDYKKVEEWEKKRFFKSEKDFVKSVEMIPYEETRNYVKLVMRNLIIYMRLLNNQRFKFPDSVL